MTEHSYSPFSRALFEGRFVVTAEIAPPRGVDLNDSLVLADELTNLVDAFNITDNQNARLRLSSLAFSHLLAEKGHDVIYQVTCRDRNRLALQSDLLGAWSLGIRNVLALTGDHITAGDHPDAAPVFDLDSIQLLSAIDTLNKGQDMTGRKMDGSTHFFPGAALACEQTPLSLALLRFRKKIRAGARFYQTQAVFRTDSILPFMEVAKEHKVFIIAGILLIHSKSMINYINNRIPGLRVPEDLSERIKSDPDPVEAGLNEAARIIRDCRPVCHGVHLMTAGRDELLPELIQRSGLTRHITSQ